MDLQTFIRETIVQVMNGVSEAHTEAVKVNGTVTPAHVHPRVEGGVTNLIAKPESSGIGPLVTLIEFDVAVTVGSTSEKGGGVKFLQIVDAGVKDGSSASTTSRVRLAIPVLLPQHAPAIPIKEKKTVSVSEAQARLRQGR